MKNNGIMNLSGKVGVENSAVSMKTAVFIAKGIMDNTIFNLDHIQNRDNCYYPYWLLREKLLENNIELITHDLLDNRIKPIFALHLDAASPPSVVPAYLLRWESSQILPANNLSLILNKFQKVFTWDDGIIDNKRFIKLFMPNHPLAFDALGYRSRKKLACLIAGNKSIYKEDPRELYSERTNTIRWFEKNKKDDFDLYGIDWHLPAAKPGFLGKVLFKVLKKLNPVFKKAPFPSYKGPVKSKHQTLLQYRFSICYENIADLQGYITEKIFDCFFAGCIPVYWGASNICDYIPQDCFISRKQFKTHEEMYLYLRDMPEDIYINYQKAIQKFLTSSEAKIFFSEHFAQTVTNTILQDLEHFA